MHIIKKYLNEFIAKYTILFFLFGVICVILVGTLAFHMIEGRSFFNSLYFTSVTMSTIWYWDIAPITHGGKLVAMLYGFMGAPLFVGLTWIFFQSKLQKMLKVSIHAYHKEAHEAEELALQMQKSSNKQNKEINKIEKEVRKQRRK